MTLKQTATRLFALGLLSAFAGLFLNFALVTLLGAILLGLAVAVDAIVIERESSNAD